MRKLKIVFLFIVFIGLFYLVQMTLINNNVVNYLIYGDLEKISMNHNNKLLRQLSSSITKIDGSNVISLLNYNGEKYLDEDVKKEIINNIINIKEPIIYIYNTHDTEEYSNIGFEGYNINLTVKLASYMLQEELLKYNIYSIVEEKEVISKLNEQNLDYKYSYDISNDYALETKKNYPSIEYFIDIHRDGIEKKLSTVTIGDKSYAKMMFLIGKNHEHSEENLKIVQGLENYLKEKYPDLMRNTYIRNEYSYFQEISPKAFIIEIGGQDNTFYEVYNSITLLAKSLAHQIGDKNE